MTSSFFTWGAFILMVNALVGVACDDGDPIEIPLATGEVGPEGGEVVAGDASLVIPSGALDEPTVFSIAQANGTTAIEDHVLVGPLIEIIPRGTTFAVPATVTLPYDSGAIPDNASENDVVLFTANEINGEFTQLASTVDMPSSTVSAEISHLSLFVPVVREPITDDEPFAPCPMHGECDCSERDARPLDITGSAELGRLVRALCVEIEGELRVTSYTVDESTMAIDEVYDTRLDSVTLEVLEEQLVALDLDSNELCQPVEKDFLSAENGDTRWSARYAEHYDDLTEERWTEALVTMVSSSNEIVYSFNRHLNIESPYLDTYAFWDDSNTLAGAVHQDGSAAFYLNNYHEGHIDVIIVNDMAAVLAAPWEHTDGEGFGIPDGQDRFELWDDPSGARGDTYAYSSLHLAASPVDSRIDLLTVFGTGPSLIRSFEVDRAGTFVERPELGLDEFWSQFGWDNAGLHDDVLFLQAGLASFSNSVLMELDPVAWTVVRQWEIGCIGPPSTHGFQMLNGGMLLRFAYDGTIDDVNRVMFIRDGDVLAIGEVPFVSLNPTYLVGPNQDVLYTAHYRTGAVRAIAVP